MSDPTPGAGISQDDIDSVKEAQEEMMPQYVTIKDRVETKDSRGGVKVTYPARAQQVIGRLGTVRDAVQTAFAGQIRGKSSAILTVPVGSGIVQQCQVVVLEGDNTTVLGEFNVVADFSKSSYSTASRYLVAEV